MYRSRALNSLEDTHHARSKFICPGLRLAHDDAGRRPGQQREKGLCYRDGEPQLESVPRRSKRALHQQHAAASGVARGAVLQSSEPSSQPAKLSLA